MKKFEQIQQTNTNLCTTEAYEGESLEEKVRRIEESNAPIEAVSPMIYTERKKGVEPQYNIRTDKWDLAQETMYKIAVNADKHKDYVSLQKENGKVPTNSAENSPQK